MFRLTDPNYLRHNQYKTSANLAARANLHIRFSTNRCGWMQWVFDQLPLRSSLRVLEVGCGPGYLWRENIARLPPDLGLCVSDLSHGMVREVQAALGAGAWLANLDAQSIPFPSGYFDIVIANHMLYHLPDVPGGVREIARVFRPGGQLFAATNGKAHLRELRALVHEFEPRYLAHPPFAEAFGLENAAGILSRDFARVEIRRYEDALWVTEAKPLADYVLSLASWDFAALKANRAEELTEFFQAKIEAEGGIHITKDSGVVIGALGDRK